MPVVVDERETPRSHGVGREVALCRRKWGAVAAARSGIESGSAQSRCPAGRSWAAGALLTEASATQRAVDAFSCGRYNRHFDNVNVMKWPSSHELMTLLTHKPSLQVDRGFHRPTCAICAVGYRSKFMHTK